MLELHRDVFARERADVWWLWLPQLIELGQTPFFADVTAALFREMWFRTLLYAGEDPVDGLKDIVAQILEACNHANLELMTQLDSFACHIFEAIPSVDPQRLLQIVHKAVSGLNQRLPATLQLGIKGQPVLRVHEKVSILSPEAVAVRMTTTQSERHHFVIQRSGHANGFHTSALTVSAAISVIRMILKRSYVARTRNLTLFPGEVLEISQSFVITPIDAVPTTLESLFQEMTGMNGDAWLRRHVESVTDEPPKFAPYDSEAPIVSPQVPFGDQTLFELTESAHASIADFRRDSLKTRMLDRLTQDQFLRLRDRFMGSFGATSLIRVLFNATYPSMYRVVVPIASGTIPILCADFDHGMISDEDTSPFSSFRLSPTIEYVLGETGRGECTIAMAAMAKALTIELETVRSFLEVLIGDEDCEAERKGSASELLTTRTVLEERFLGICPPVFAEGAEAWLRGIEQIIDDAANPTTQPIEAIPWF
jgi:hypothetical protein